MNNSKADRNIRWLSTGIVVLVFLGACISLTVSVSNIRLEVREDIRLRIQRLNDKLDTIERDRINKLDINIDTIERELSSLKSKVAELRE